MKKTINIFSRLLLVFFSRHSQLKGVWKGVGADI